MNRMKKKTVMNELRDYVMIAVGMLSYCMGGTSSSCPTASRQAAYQV